MDRNDLLTAINKYYNTLLFTGSIKSKEYSYLVILTFLKTIVEIGRNLGLDQEDLKDLNLIIQCMRDGNICVANHIEYVNKFNDGTQLDDHIITPEEVIMITHDDIDLVSEERVTKKFTDFNQQYIFDSSDFIVGYDNVTKSENRVNVGTIAAVWS